jgi:hypothetical protein
MTILHITNTGKLNYHLKLLGALIAKDEEGKYFLTERGKLAANMMKTFPKKVRVEKKNQTVKIAAGVLMVLLGVALIGFAVVVFLNTSVHTGEIMQTENFSNRTIPQNTTAILSVDYLPNLMLQNYLLFGMPQIQYMSISLIPLNIMLYTYNKIVHTLHGTSMDCRQITLVNMNCRREAFL